MTKNDKDCNSMGKQHWHRQTPTRVECFERGQWVGVEVGVEVVNWRECMKGASQLASTLPERP